MTLLAAAVEDIRDIHGPVVLPAQPPVVLLVALGAAVLLLGGALVWWWRRRRAPLNAEQAAMQELERARPLIESGDAPAFSSRVSDAVRTYVEVAFSVRAPRRTTEELLADLLRTEGPVAAHRAELEAFLKWCDLAKYARFSLSGAQMNGMLESAQTFVRATAAPSTGATA